MIPKSFNTVLSKIEESINDLSANDFEFYRKEDGRLKVIGKSGDYMIPVIPLRPHQSELQHQLFVEKKQFIYVWRPRRSGKEVESWNMIIQGAITVPGLYLMIYPTNVRARFVLWDGAIVLENEESLKFIDMIPRELVKSKNDHEMTIKLTNGSVVRVLGADIDPDKLRGGNPRGIVMSEYAFADPRVRLILMPVLRQNKGWLILQTTPNGMNHAYTFMHEMKSNPAWFCRIDTVETIVDEHGNRYIGDDLIEEERRAKMPEWLLRQEYYCDVKANLETLYFSKEIAYILENDRLVINLFVRDKPVYAAMDIGINDTCALTIFQIDHVGDPVVIGYYENNNQNFEHYLRYLESFCLKNNLYYRDVFVPHDGQKRDFNTGKNSVDFGSDLGFTVVVVKRPTSKFNAIQSMRRMAYRTRFNKENTERLVECMSNYSKEFDEDRGVYKDQPRHDWSSHGVDSYQTMTLAIESEMISTVQHNVGHYTQ